MQINKSFALSIFVHNNCRITTFLSNSLQKLIKTEKTDFSVDKLKQPKMLFASIYSLTKISSNVSVPHPCDSETCTSLTREWKSSGCNHFMNLIFGHGKSPLLRTFSYGWKCNVTEMTQWNWIAITCTGARKNLFIWMYSHYL